MLVRFGRDQAVGRGPLVDPLMRRDVMAELLLLEFEGVAESEYRSVNAELGIDPDTGKGDWPAGLITTSPGWQRTAAFS